MTQLALASKIVPMRQVLVRGRFYETLTNRGIMGFNATLDYSHAWDKGTFRTAQTVLPGGYFALHLDPGRTMPDLTGVDSVTLILKLTRASAPPITAQADVDGAALAITEQIRSVGSQPVKVHRIEGAPFAFELSVPPAPMLLDGLLLRDNDPADPAAGVTVSASGIPDVITDSEGRFRIPALPFSESLPLRFDDGGTVSERTLRPTWGDGPMARTFSLPSP
uniref:hypothetical protein n=1 Tax=uncultured Halomonas sp. TaxID=173971 RepID=UPI00260B90E9|nr:hypothetical protein [uncultured Halomonas sp.]